MAAPLRAQDFSARRPIEGLVIGGRVDLQMVATSEDEAAPASEFLLRRARIWVAGRINDWIEGVVVLELGKGDLTGRYLFARFDLDPALVVTAGQFKRAFDLFQLTPSSQILAIERDGAPAGAARCTGVGGICSYSRFSERLQLSSLDIGVLLEGQLAAGRFAYAASVTNGEGGNRRATNGAKSFAGRLEWAPVGRLRLAGNVSIHDYVNAVLAADRHATATSLDLEWGAYGEDGFHVQAGVMHGENWLALDPRGAEPDFLTYQAIVTYRVPLDPGGKVRALEPVGRVSWGDPDRSVERDDGWLFTPGLLLHLPDRNRLAANLDVWRPASGSTAWGLRIQTMVFF